MKPTRPARDDGAGAALQILDHNTGFLHVLQKQQLNRDCLQTERMERIQRHRLKLFVRWKLLPTHSALVTLGIRVSLVVVPHVFRAVLGMGNCRSCPEQCALRGRWRDILIILPLDHEQCSAGLQGS